MANVKPITNAQRRAAEQLLREEEARLQQEFAEEFHGDSYGKARLQAQKEWLDAHPEFVEVAKRAAAYAKRANKRMAEFAEEATQTAPNVEWTHPSSIYIGSALLVLSPSRVPHPHVKAPWDERVDELIREHEVRQQRVWRAITKRIEKGRRDILLATVGGIDKSLITLPTLAEILTEVAQEV